MNCSGVAGPCVIIQKILLDRRVGQTGQLLELLLSVDLGEIELLFCELEVLLGKELRRKLLAPFSPVPLICSLVNNRKLLLSVLVIVIPLTPRTYRGAVRILNALLDEGAEGIVRVFRVDGLKDGVVLVGTEHRRAALLVGIEDYVHAIRQIVGIDRHALNIVGPINKDPNLRIVGVAEGNIVHTPSKLNKSVLLLASLRIVRIPDLDPA